METFFFGKRNSDNVLIQIADEHDLPLMSKEVSMIQSLSQESSFMLAALKIESPNDELSPWQAPPVFGSKPFGNGAEKTLSYITDRLIPSLRKEGSKRFFLGGYSLAGLFALWAAYKTDAFSGIAAVSPSVWFENFTDYVKSNKAKSSKIYLSLGIKEEKTKNPVLANVGSAIKEIYGHLIKENLICTLEWNPGNHFQNPETRTAKGFAWLLGDGT